MKRAAIVTLAFLVYACFYWYLCGPLLTAAKKTMTPADVHSLTLTVGLFGFPFFVGLPLVGLLWVVVLFRWVLGGKRQAPARVEQFPPPPPHPEREQYTLTGRRLP